MDCGRSYDDGVSGVVTEMYRWEPARWQAAMAKRDDVREIGEGDVQRPRKVIDGDTFVLKDKMREVGFFFWVGTYSGRWICVVAEGAGAVYGGCGGEWAAE